LQAGLSSALFEAGLEAQIEDGLMDVGLQLSPELLS